MNFQATQFVSNVSIHTSQQSIHSDFFDAMGALPWSIISRPSEAAKAAHTPSPGLAPPSLVCLHLPWPWQPP